MFVSMTTVGAAPGANCTAEALAMRLSKCNTLQSAVASELSTDSEKMLHQLCNSSDCSIQCYNDVFRPCTHMGLGRLADFTVQKVAIRYVCANFKAIKACDKELVHSNCVSAMISSMTNVSGMLASPQPDYDAYFQAYCRLAKNYKSCVPSLQLGANTQCTQDLAKKALNSYNITLSLASCGIKQDMPEFALYGGPVVCNNPPMVG